MPVIIFKPRQYKAGFAKDKNGYPINGEVADPPNDRDLKVCEISRFEGWTTECYCDTGEFEITTRDVDPAHISTDNVVFFEDRLFVIETIKWERDSEGYVCTFGGRDMWKFLESINNTPSTYTGFSRSLVIHPVHRVLHVGDVAQGASCGWFADEDRKGGNYHTDRLGSLSAEDFRNETIESYYVQDVMSYKSMTRLFSNITGCGVELHAKYNSVTGLFEHCIYPTHYSDNVVSIDASDRGVSSFSYVVDERNVTNATIFSYKRNPYKIIGGGTGTRKRFEYYNKLSYADTEATGDKERRLYAYHCKRGSAKNYAELANKFTERIITADSIPSDVDTRTKFAQWVNGQMTEDYANAETSVSFDYDNQGRYRFGRDFFLGDYVNITDGFLGVKSRQKLVKVKRDYKAGSVVSYSFEFGSQKTTQSDKLKTKFREIDRRTFGVPGFTE